MYKSYTLDLQVKNVFSKIFTEFQTTSSPSRLGFDFWRKSPYFPQAFSTPLSTDFNYYSINPSDYKLYVSPNFYLDKRKYNTFELGLEKIDSNSTYSDLKITNLGIKNWADVWIDSDTGLFVDPKIEKMDLSHNNLINFSILDPRDKLKFVNISHNQQLTYVNLSGNNKLEAIILDDCQSISYINLSGSRDLRIVSLKNCSMDEKTMEGILRNFFPVKTYEPPSYPQYLANRQFNSYIDLRGNQINWLNRNIASKIRLLLANDWVVLWSNDPPESVIPVQYYKLLNPILDKKAFSDYLLG